MKRFCIGKNGVVVNVIGALDISDLQNEVGDVFEDLSGVASIGTTYAAVEFAKEAAYSKLEVVTFKILFQLINDVRALKVPPQVPLTVAQFKTYVKNQMA